MSVGKLQKLTGWAAAMLLGILALLSLSRGISNAIGSADFGMSIDLHSYWSPARVFLQGKDPYAAALNNTLPALAMNQGMPNNPANSALMLVILAPLALLEWPVARIVWALVNILLGLMIPWAALRLAPYKTNWWIFIILEFAFFAVLPTRNVISNGQTSLLVLAATFLAVGMAKDRPWLAGYYWVSRFPNTA